MKISEEFGYVFSAVGGAVIALVSVRVFIQGLNVMTLPPITDFGRRISPLEPVYPLLTLIAVVIGIVGGFQIYRKHGSTRLLTVISYIPAVLLGFVALPFIISLVGETEGIFYGGYRMALAPVGLIFPVVLFVEAWRIALDKIPIAGFWNEQNNQDQLSVNGRKRRKLLGFSGVTTLSFIGYGFFGKNPHRKERIKDNKIIVPDDFELSDLSYGYFEEDNEYRVTGKVTPIKAAIRPELSIEWYIGGGVGLAASSIPLDTGFSGKETAQFRAVVKEDDFGFEPSEIERFDLEITEGRIPAVGS